MQKEELNLPLRIATARKLVASLSCLNTAILVGFCRLSPAVAGNTETLPPGNYIYLGEPSVPGTSQRFSIDNSGKIIWKTSRNKDSETDATVDDSGADPRKPSQSESSRFDSRPSSRSSQPYRREAQPADGEATPAAAKQEDASPFEEYKFPTIKWKPKPIKGKAGAVAQLLTTIGPRPVSTYSGDMLKARLTLFKVGRALILGHYQRVTLFDSNGFQVAVLPFYSFRKIPGTGLLEGESMIELYNIRYGNAVDYTVE